MALDRLTADQPSVAVRVAVERYLAELDGRLSAPNRIRQTIRDELRDGLLEAQECYRAAGLADEEAVAAALAEFGEPATVAAAFAPELATRDARRVTLALLRSGPLVGLTWALAAFASGMPVGHAPPWRWPLPGIHLGFPLIATAITTSILAGLLTIAATGRLTAVRCGHPPATLVTAAATIIATSAVVCDLALLTLLTIGAAIAPGPLMWPPACLAATVSVTRLALAQRAAQRMLATRRALR